MKRLMCLLIVAALVMPMMAIPVFAGGEYTPYTETEVDEITHELVDCEKELKTHKALSQNYRRQYMGAMRANSECQEEQDKLQKAYGAVMAENIMLNAVKEEEEDTSLTSRWILGALGVWGVSTGGAYGILTGAMFIYSALK